MNNGYSCNELYRLTQAAEKVMENVRHLSSQFDTFFTTKLMKDGVTPLEFWSDAYNDFQEMDKEQMLNLFEDSVNLNRKLLDYFAAVISELVNLSKVVSTISDVVTTHERDLNDIDTNFNEIFHALDMHERSLVNMSNKTPSFAIISGGKNHESNIPGCNQPDPKASGEGSEGVTKDSPQ